MGDFEVAYYLTPPGSPPSEWILLERETLGGLDAGDDEDESEQVTVPANVMPGRYGFVIVLDDRSLVAERDETNNDYGFTLIVTAPVGSESAPDAGSFGLRASPNPAGASVSLAFTLVEARTVRIAVSDALGRTVAVVERAAGAGPHTEALDVSGLPPGVYVARLVAGDAAPTVRFTVVR